MVAAAVPEKQISCISLQLFSVRVALFFALRFFFLLGLFGVFALNFGFLFGFFFCQFLFFLFFGHGRFLSGSIVLGNGLT